jgi:hypothetical protein
MKIDFNGQEMAIRFDKVPKFLYFNEESKGVGKVFLNGIQKKGLQDIRMHANTRESGEWPDLKYRVQYVDKESGGEPQFIGNMSDGLSITVKIADLDIFNSLIDWAKKVTSDECIPQVKREEYYNSLKELLNRFEKGDK